MIPVGKEPGDSEECKPVDQRGFSEHVLFATDFSEIAGYAFSQLEQLVAGCRKVTLVHIQDKVKLEQHLKPRLEEFDQHDLERLKELKQTLLKKGTPAIDMEVLHGTPYEEIARLVRESNVQMVIMGTQGLGFVVEVFLGSVSHNVVSHSVAPVLLIPVPDIN